MSKQMLSNATELKEQVKNAVSSKQLECGHRGKCPTCPTCKRFNDDGFPPVNEGWVSTSGKPIGDKMMALLQQVELEQRAQYLRNVILQNMRTIKFGNNVYQTKRKSSFFKKKRLARIKHFKLFKTPLRENV